LLYPRNKDGEQNVRVIKQIFKEHATWILLCFLIKVQRDTYSIRKEIELCDLGYKEKCMKPICNEIEQWCDICGKVYRCYHLLCFRLLSRELKRKSGAFH